MDTIDRNFVRGESHASNYRPAANEIAALTDRFGMTTPTTWAGRALLVLYGFFGCSGAILFFNLFLERIITLLACLLKAIHERDLRRRGLLDRRDSQ
ncbi:hypothetical protein HPB47_012299, partial [Ixodes persulcatus]